MDYIAALISENKAKQIEVIFIAVFSVLILVMFSSLVSMNGVLLGNDPAVHLEKAQIFLNTGEISLANLSWTPPLFQIVLAMTISMSGATEITQYISILRILITVLNWLLFISVYLLARKFFNRKVAIASVILLMMCFPIYEANQFGGYTTVFALAFMALVLLYTPLAVDHYGYLVVAFFAAFSLVLGHQLGTFLAAFIFPPIFLYMLIKSRGKDLKVVLALTLGGGIAFFLYYFQAMYAYLGDVIKYVFFEIKSYVYQIPVVSFSGLMMNYGFILFVGLAGVGVSFYVLWKHHKPLYWLILVLALFVPFFFAESYLVGFYMPFAWFIYYVTLPLAILAAVTVVFAADKSYAYYLHHRSVFKKLWVKVAAVALIVVVGAVVVYRVDTVYSRITEASVYYSTTDLKAMDAGLWLKENYPDFTSVVVTKVPGFWFQEFSGKNVTAQTDKTVQYMDVAEAVLTLAYELEHPQTMLKAYQAKGDTLDEYYVSMHKIWMRTAFSSSSGDTFSYTLSGAYHEVGIDQFNKEVVFQNQADPKSITLAFSNDDVVLTKTISAQNNSYPFDVSWTVTPLLGQITNASLYLTTHFDLQYEFNVADIPGLMNWINPYDAPEPIKTTDPKWAAVSFAGANLKDNYIGLYDETNNVGYAMHFTDLPAWGNIGSLPNRQIDAVRFVYNFDSIQEGQTVERSYQTATLSQASYPALTRDSLQGLFNQTVEPFDVKHRDFRNYIERDNIGFIVYDRNELDTQIINSKILQLVYSNDRYVIFRILK
ncbi:MAG: hypothetical protein GX799_00710 [Crenarchaeota archaeon]|nr:hypothetical protein [Thermoproteota archaeon]